MSLVELPVGSDPFRAQVISDMCTDEGIHNDLVLRDDPYVGLDWQLDHLIVVDESQLSGVERVITDYFPDMLADEPVEPLVRSKRPATWVRWLVAAAILGPIAYGMVMMIDQVISAF